MKQRSESEPRLRQIQTARIRDGRRSNDDSPLHNNYMSAQKMGGVYKYFLIKLAPSHPTPSSVTIISQLIPLVSSKTNMILSKLRLSHL